MRLLNEVRIRGYAGKDMEVRNGKNGDYATFSIGVSRGKDKETDWFYVCAGGKQVDWIDVKKGDLVEVKGKLCFSKSEKYGMSATIFAEQYGGVENCSNWGSGSNGGGDSKRSSGDVNDEDLPF